MKNIAILGATGSIGTQTLDVIRSQREDFCLVGVSADTNVEKIIEIINEFKPEYIAMKDSLACKAVREYCVNKKFQINVLDGIDGLNTISSIEKVEMVVTSMVGMAGLIPTITAIRKGKDIALANKETLVVAGELVVKEAEIHNVKILPVDSEHSAIFQCIQGNEKREVQKILLTASGGPFRGKRKEDLANVSSYDALKHPNWNMGKKISIDSATLMNKGLEVIEAHWLFSMNYDSIDVVVHPQSIIHSMVEYCDGSVIAQLGTANMRLPIQYALNYPSRKSCIVERLDFSKTGTLTFEEPDKKTFRCLELAYEAGRIGKLMPTILNGANEACVDLFLQNLINFNKIADIIEDCMNKFDFEKKLTIDSVIEMDIRVKEYVNNKYK